LLAEHQNVGWSFYFCPNASIAAIAPADASKLQSTSSSSKQGAQVGKAG